MNTLRKTIRQSILLLSVFALTANGCSKKDDEVVTMPPPVNEEELITTVMLTFTDPSGNVSTATFRDPDGDGGNGPTEFDTIRLARKTVYDVAVTLLDESKSPAEDITKEVEEESEQHLFCFTSNAHVDIVRTDSDGKYEIGLESQWTTHDMTGTGTVKVVLKHQPGVKDGSCDPGETDVEVEFITEVD